MVSRGAPAAQQRAQPRRQFGEGERFDHVVVGPTVETGDPVVHGILRGQDQDRELSLSRPDVAQDLKPGPARQHQSSTTAS